MKKPSQSLPDMFHRVISLAIDEKGVYPHKALWLDRKGKLCMGAIVLQRPIEIMAWLIGTVNSGATELVYGMDRFAKPGQGTTLGDLVAGAHFAGGEWKPFTIEYRHEARIVKPIDWSNAFWTSAVLGELHQCGLARAKGGAA